MFVFLHPDVMQRLCTEPEERQRFVQAMRSCPGVILEMLPFAPRKRRPEPRIVLIPSSCRRQREYRREELVICCDRFDLIEKITLLAYISMLQMRIEQEVMEGQ